MNCTTCLTGGTGSADVLPVAPMSCSRVLTTSARGAIPILGQDVAPQVGNQPVVDAHRTFEGAATAGGAVIKRLRHLLHLSIG